MAATTSFLPPLLPLLILFQPEDNCEEDNDRGANLLLFKAFLFSFSRCLPFLLSLLRFQAEHMLHQEAPSLAARLISGGFPGAVVVGAEPSSTVGELASVANGSRFGAVMGKTKTL